MGAFDKCPWGGGLRPAATLSKRTVARALGCKIDRGFARMALPDGRTLGLIDVPGHGRFIGHMVAGATNRCGTKGSRRLRVLRTR